MDATFIGLLQSQINSLQESEADSDSNIIILETIKLLLCNVNLSADTLSLYDKFGMRRLFAAYGETGKQICSFYDSCKYYLDPAAMIGSIGKTITETEGQIKATTAAFDEMSTKEADLLAKEDELRANDAKYKVLKDKTTELRAIHETVSEDVISAIEKENEQLEADIKKGKKHKEAVADENKKLRKLLSEVEETNTEVDNEQSKIKMNIIDIIQKNYDEIQAIFMGRRESLDAIKADIERSIREFESLDSAVLEYEETRTFYEMWLGENSTIIENMRKYGLESIGQLTDAINSAKENAKYELNAYDTVVKKVLMEEEAIREVLKRKQNKWFGV